MNYKQTAGRRTEPLTAKGMPCGEYEGKICMRRESSRRIRSNKVYLFDMTAGSSFGSPGIDGFLHTILVIRHKIVYNSDCCLVSKGGRPVVKVPRRIPDVCYAHQNRSVTVAKCQDGSTVRSVPRVAYKPGSRGVQG